MTKMTTIPDNCDNIRAGIVELLDAARTAASRTVNALMTGAYWEIGRRIVESEQLAIREPSTEMYSSSGGPRISRLRLAEALDRVTSPR